MNCRFCKTPLTHQIINLGQTPLANGYLHTLADAKNEQRYPLQLYRCGECQLVQLEYDVTPEQIFNQHYAFLSSSSATWQSHCAAYAAEMQQRLGAKQVNLIVEVGANDGTLLGKLRPLSTHLLGIDPASAATQLATAKNIPVITDFFTTGLAKSMRAEGKLADVIVANNVLAHVPKINDFVEGLSMLLQPEGIITVEFPYLPNIIEQTQFDTIYHEHYFYFSVSVLQRVFARYGLAIYDLQPLEIHGGSLRIFVKHYSNASLALQPIVDAYIQKEQKAGLHTIAYYQALQDRAQQIKHAFTTWLQEVLEQGKKVMAYGAAAKGNTFLNYCGVNATQIHAIADVTPEKQGKFLPGSHIPIVSPEAIAQAKPDYLLILAWNYKKEINPKLAYTGAWGCQLVYFIPQFEVYQASGLYVP